MGDTTTEVDADWIKPGAEVIVYSTGQNPNPRKATVLKVAAKSFTLDGISERIRLADLRSKSLGSVWDAWEYAVVHPGSEKARELARWARLRMAQNQAVIAVREWDKSDARADASKIHAAVTALNAYRHLLGGGSDVQ